MADTSTNPFGNLQGQMIGRYKLESFLGSGAMADVYRSTHPELKRDVAVKILHPHRTRMPGFIERFRHEAAASASLIHPNIIQVYDFDVTENGLYYMVMQYINGPSLEDYLSLESEPLSLLKAYNFLAPIAAALQHAHQLDTIHRDVKPGNIMLDTRENAFLGDFGLAKIIGIDMHTDSGIGPGTPAYMAPEQIENRDITPAVDIYALGMVLYKMLTGRLPFDDESLMSVIFHKATEPAPSPRKFNPDLPPEVEEVIVKAVAREPKARFADAYLLTVAYHKAAAKYVDDLPELASVTSAGFIPLPSVEIADYKIQREFTSDNNDIYKRYLAHNSSLGVPAVLSILSATKSSNAELVEQFQKRLETLALIDHPNIAAFTRSDLAADKRPYVAYEFIDGHSLATRLEEWTRHDSALPVLECFAIIRQLADALSAVDKANLIHQELIPENIIITPDNTPIIVGLEIPRTSKMLAKKANREDPGYIPPEQYTDGAVDIQANIYSLGVMLYELLAGYRPRMPMWDLIELTPNDIPRATPVLLDRDGFSAETHELLGKSVTTVTDLRYKTLEAFISQLDKAAAAEEKGAVAPPPPVYTPPPLPIQRPNHERYPIPPKQKREWDRRLLYLLPLLLLIPILGLIGWYLFSSGGNGEGDDGLITPTAVINPTESESDSVIVAPPTATSSPTFTATPSTTPTASATPTSSATATATQTQTPTAVLTPSSTPTPSNTPTPSTCPPPFGWVAYTVQAGDTFSVLASISGITVERLLEANCLDGTILSIGQRLWLPPLPATAVPTETAAPTADGTTATTEPPGDGNNPPPPTSEPQQPTRTPPPLPTRTPPRP